MDSRLKTIGQALWQLGVTEEDLKSCAREASGSALRMLDIAEERKLVRPEQAQELRTAVECSEDAARLFLQAYLAKKPVVLLLKGLEELLKGAGEGGASPGSQSQDSQVPEKPTKSIPRERAGPARNGVPAERRPNAPSPATVGTGSPPAQAATAEANLEDSCDDEDPKEKTQPVEALLADRESPRAAQSVLGNRSTYERVTRLGHGRLTQTLKARDKATGEVVVLKVFPSEWVRNLDFVDRLFDKVRGVIGLEHPNLARIRQIVVSDHECYAVREYVEGVPLKSILNSSKQLSAQQALAIFDELLQGTKALHELGLCHGSIHPGNIVVDAEGRACLTDAGVGALGMTGPGADLPEGPWLYQALYLAPERHRSSAGPTLASDIYELGIVLYHLLTWNVPYPSHDRQELAEKHATGPLPPFPDTLQPLADPLRRVLDRMTATSPGDRYSSVDEILRELRGLKVSLPGRLPLASGAEARNGAAAAGRGAEGGPPVLRRHRRGRSPLPQKQWQTYVAIAVALLVSAAVYAFWPSDPLNWQPKGLAEKARNLSVGGKLDEDVAAKLAAEGDVALPVLRFLVEKGPPEKQIPAAKTLGMIATPRSRALLVEQLGHRRIEVRAEVLMILGRSTWPGAYEHLAKALEAKEPEVRRNAVIALGEFGDPRAIPLIHARLQDGDVSVRQQAKTSLDRLGGSAPTDGATPPRTGQEQ